AVSSDGVQIATTTTTTAPPTTAPASTSTSTTSPATSVPSTGGTTTTPPTTAPPTTPAPTTAPPTVGDPVVALQLVERFDTPVGLAVRPGDPAFYVIEQAGRVVRFDESTGERQTVLDIADDVDFGGERGLLGLAFSL